MPTWARIAGGAVAEARTGIGDGAGGETIGEGVAAAGALAVGLDT